MENADTVVGVVIISGIAIGLYRLAERLLYRFGKVKLNNKDDSGITPVPPGDPVYNHQMATLLKDAAVSISECVVVTRRVEKLLERVEVTLGHIDRLVSDDQQQEPAHLKLRGQG